MIVVFLLNSLWIALAVALLCACIERAKVHPLIREWTWTLGLVLAVAVPLGTLLPQRSPALQGFRLAAVVSAPAAASGFDWTRVLTATYVAAMMFAAIRLLWRWTRLRRLDEHTIAVPMTFCRQILLPARFRSEAPPLAIEAALAHERTHLERRDFARNIAIELATLPVALHPAVWYMKGRLAQARELVCDDLTARAFGDRRRYAQGLVEAARALAPPPAPAQPAMGMLDHTDFEERIMLLNHPAPRTLRRGYGLLALMLAVAPAMTLFGFYYQQDEPVKDANPPRLIYKEEPEYPEELQKDKVAGTVVLGTQISPAGLAEKIVVKRSLHPQLDESAVEALKKWRFEPGTKDGVAVRVAATVEINFRMK
jgi:TonB family protein